ncbi:MAG: ATP-binding cassette domain-containing protein [Cryobacterium sp.]|nr:ATP-binding cassette domain-containing protein [Cryobacterium sp.]
MIEVEHLSKRFGNRLALDDVSFRVDEGKVTAFLGPNGAGKTTTMRLILGLDRPTAGRALVGGRPFREHPDPICQVGALLDTKFAHPKRTAFDHLLVVAATHALPRSRVHDVIDETGLDSVAGERVGRFSLGMTQRLGIAAALLGSPKALILDEPVNGLDIDGVRWFRELCRRYASEGAAVFLSSHLMSEVERVADHVIVLGRGRVIENATLADLRRGAAVVDAASERASELATELGRRGASIRVLDDRALAVTGLSAGEVGAIAARAGIPLEHLSEESRSLEESYRALTEDEIEFHASNDPDASTA